MISHERITNQIVRLWKDKNMSLDTEYEEYFGDSGGDAYDRLKKEYDLLHIVVMELTEELKRMVEWDMKKLNDLSGRLLSIKKAKDRTNELKEGI